MDSYDEDALPDLAEPTGGPEVRSVGWDASGDWMWAAVIPHSRSKHQPWPTYKPLARFRTKADAEAYIRLLETTPALSSVTKRLYEALASAWKAAGIGEAGARQFYTMGMPDDEREALIRILPVTEVEWIRSSDSSKEQNG